MSELFTTANTNWQQTERTNHLADWQHRFNRPNLSQQPRQKQRQQQQPNPVVHVTPLFSGSATPTDGVLQDWTRGDRYTSFAVTTGGGDSTTEEYVGVSALHNAWFEYDVKSAYSSTGISGLDDKMEALVLADPSPYMMDVYQYPKQFDAQTTKNVRTVKPVRISCATRSQM